MPAIPDIVHNFRLETHFYADYTLHVHYRSGATLNERRTKVEVKWVRKRQLGRGSYGCVYLEHEFPKDQKKNQVRAVKVLPKNSSDDYHRELETTAFFSHPKYQHCFVQSFGWYEDVENIFIAMEFCRYGDIHKYLKQPLPEGEARSIVSQLLEALSFMHQNHFTHRDLKPTNILVKCPGPGWWIKIADFGISKRVAAEDTALRTIAGSPAFIAPEILGLVAVAKDGAADAYTNAVDIWSLGVVTVQILTGQILFKDLGQLTQFVAGMGSSLQGFLSQHTLSQHGQDFVNMTLALNPQGRSSAVELLRHSWILAAPERQSGFVQSPTNDRAMSPQNELLSPVISTVERTAASARWTTLERRVSNGLRTMADPSVESIIICFSNLARENQQSTTSLQENGLASPEPMRSNLSRSSSLRPLISEPCQSIYNKTLLDTINEQLGRGRALYKQSMFAEAEKCLQNVLTGNVEVPGNVDEHTECTFFWLGCAQFKLGKYSQAGLNFKEVYKFREMVRGRNHQDTADALYWLGRTQYKRRKYTSAELALQSALEINEQVLGHNHEHTASSLHLLGLTQYHLRKYTQAEISHTSALGIRVTALSSNHGDTANSLHQLGRAQHQLKKYLQAELNHKSALEIRVTLLGHSHKDTADCLHWLGLSQYELENYSSAEVAFQSALEINQEELGHNSQITETSLYWLGRTQYRLKKFFEAELNIKGALKTKELLPGHDQTYRTEYLFMLGCTQCELRNYSSAVVTFQSALEIDKNTRDCDVEMTACFFYWLGHAQYQLQNYSEAEMSFQSALEIREKFLNNEDQRIAQSLLGQGLAQRAQKKHSQAQLLLRRALEIYEKSLGSNHRRTRDARVLYVDTLFINKTNTLLRKPRDWWRRVID